MGRLGCFLLASHVFKRMVPRPEVLIALVKMYNLRSHTRPKNLVVFLKDFWMTQLYIRN